MSVIKYKENSKIMVIPIGRAGIDFNTQKLNVPFKESLNYKISVGGSPANIAQGVARLGLKTGFIGKISKDGMGDYIKETFEKEGIDTSQLIFDQSGAPNCLAITEIKSPSKSGSFMYRNGTADTLLTAEEIDEEYIKNAASVVISGTALSTEPTRSAMYKVAEYAKKHNTLLIVDVDFRPYGWKSPEETSEQYNKILNMCDIIIGNREEFDAVEYNTMPNNKNNRVSAEYFLNKSAQLVIVKDGEKGSIGYLKGQEPIHCPIIKVEAKKTFGSGDAYASGLLYGLFNDLSLFESMKFGSACASITLTGMSCGEDMPTVLATKEFMKTHEFSEVLM